jgi:hypothetical protein
LENFITIHTQHPHIQNYKNLVILIKFSLCLADKKDITKLKIASDDESIL